MKKKLLIGSIIALCILIGVSFTSVVGYNSIEFGVNASPLFNIRNYRAIGTDERSLTSNYLGSGEEIDICLPPIDSKGELIEKILHNIQTLDDISFDNLVSLVKSRIKQKSIDEKEIKFVLNYQRIIYKMNETMVLLSWNEPCTIDAWFPGCIIINILSTIVDSIYAFLVWIKNIRHSISYIIPGCCETWN
jgi:hypothetical protein